MIHDWCEVCSNPVNNCGAEYTWHTFAHAAEHFLLRVCEWTEWATSECSWSSVIVSILAQDDSSKEVCNTTESVRAVTTVGTVASCVRSTYTTEWCLGTFR
jgi:hypothetical protein